jgi:hypothetical protein
MKMRQWIWFGIYFVIWFLAFNLTEQFFRFKFGLNRIALFYLLIGLAILLLFVIAKLRKRN